MKTRAIIRHLSGISDYRYNVTFFESGINYLNYETKHDDVVVSSIAQTEKFWAWWEQIVEQRNVQYLKEFGGSFLSCRELFYIWESMLSVRSLHVYPPLADWDCGYMDLVQELMRESRLEVVNNKIYSHGR